MTLIGLGYLIIRLLMLAVVYFGIKWLIESLGIRVPDMILKIFAAILVILGVIFVLQFIGVSL